MGISLSSDIQVPPDCKLPAHMHNKVSVVDGFSFWISSRNSFQGQNLLLCKLLLFLDQISGGGEQKSLRGHPLWKKARLQTALCDYEIH